jgi:hypothetical protein
VRGRIGACAAAFVLLWPAPRAAHAQPPASDTPFFTARYDSRFRFRTISTARFEIHYHQGEDALAQRLARIAEEVAAQLEPRLGATRRRVHVILVDQSDEANGWATVVPYNLIEISAVPPRAASLIGNTDDWLRLVFTHEYTHAVHLEKSGGWLGSLRHVFGRLPIFYPNLFLPEFLVEGIATYEESALTGRGRVHAGDFRLLRGRYDSLDRASGGIIEWPSGNRPYAYGAYFHECLAELYGAESFGRLARETAGRLPFLGTRAFRDVYGAPLGTLWLACRDKATDWRKPGASVDTPFPTRLTQHGFVVTAPVFSPDGRLFYSASNPHGFPALQELAADGTGARKVATRFRGNRLAATRDLLVFDQLEVVRDVDTQSDIYAVPLDGGDTRRLTRHARAADPDVAPDGKTVVCTVQQTGRRILATFTIPPDGGVAEPQPLVAEDATEFTAPRWSPDGKTIAAERQRLGGPSEIVTIDVQTREVRTVVSSSPARNVSPTWLPDGRTLLFSSDRNGEPFMLYGVDVATADLKQFWTTFHTAQSPALSPDGKRLVFVGYSPDGYDLFELAFDSARWRPVEAAANPQPRAAAPAQRIPGVSGDRPYSPWPTLRPRFWVPVIEVSDEDVSIGAATAGYDALGRHGFGVTAAWSTAADRSEWQVDYTYARWRPAFFASLSQDVDALSRRTLWSRELTAGVLLPARRVRWSMSSLAGLHVSRDDVECPSCQVPRQTSTRGALRAGWRFSNARAFGYSISAEEGASVQLTAEVARRALGSDGDANAVTADARGYLRVFPRHGVLAARIAGASAWGDDRVRRAFSAGGSGPQLAGFDFGVGAIGLLRGLEESDLVGDRAAVLNVDYRVPLAWIERGAGTLPFLLRSVHAAVFFDAGHAWDDRFRARDLRRSVGAELSLDVVLGYALPVTVATGAAWRHGGSDDRGGVAAFVRVGRAF